MSSISCFPGGSRLHLASSAQRRQSHTSAGPVLLEVRSVRLTLPLLLTTYSWLGNLLRHPPFIPPRVQLQASVFDVCKSRVRGVPHLTQVIDLKTCRLSRLCSPFVSFISMVAGPPTPLAPPSSSSPSPCCLNGVSSIRLFHRRTMCPFAHDMGYVHVVVGLTSPIRFQGISKFRPSCSKSSQSLHLPVDSSGPSLSSSASFLKSALPPFLWRCFSISITVLLSCGAVRSGPEDAAGFVSTSFRGADWMSTSQFKVTISLLSDHVVKATLTHSNTVLSLLSSSSFEDLSVLSYDIVVFTFNQRGWTIPSIICNQSS
ncbi:Uncharacterized protein Rs2_26148 [Raphanus sativus]|nr:Uncharacterized protein Rs2_26148 [Raphanus sativus]